MPIHEAAMWSAYQQTTYVAWPGAAVPGGEGRLQQHDAGGDTPGDQNEVSIHVGRVTPALDGLLDDRGARSWCFVTAANPGSERLDDPENAQRNDVLKCELEAAGFAVFAGAGRGQDGLWPAEPSFLVIGPDRAAATALGVRHGQNAVVFGERGGRAELIDCRGHGSTDAAAVPGSPASPRQREAPRD